MKLIKSVIMGNLPKGIKSSPILSHVLPSHHHESFVPNDIAPPRPVFLFLCCACLALFLDNANAVNPAPDVGVYRHNGGVTTSCLGACPPLGECSQAHLLYDWHNPSNAPWRCQAVCTPRLCIR